jgi:hypothetical protein
MSTVVALLVGWGAGLLIAALGLVGWDLMRGAGTEKVLSVLGLMMWVVACIILAVLLAVWWLPSS